MQVSKVKQKNCKRLFNWKQGIQQNGNITIWSSRCNWIAELLINSYTQEPSPPPKGICYIPKSNYAKNSPRNQRQKENLITGGNRNTWILPSHLKDVLKAGISFLFKFLLTASFLIRMKIYPPEALVSRTHRFITVHCDSCYTEQVFTYWQKS